MGTFTDMQIVGKLSESKRRKECRNDIDLPSKAKRNILKV